MSTADHHKALARKAINIWSTGDVRNVDEVYASNCINHLQHSPQKLGPDAWGKYINEFRDAFPDFQNTIEDQIAEGNKVVTRFTSRGSHKGLFMGVEPSNKKISWTGISIDRIENGKIVETWVNWDMYSMLEQMGALSLNTIL